jgi:hypothetical protein
MGALRPSKDEPLARSLGGSGTPLHAATDWPGFFANGPDVVAVLIDAGADPNAATPMSPGH